MQISEKGIELITRFEGFSATPYICPAGKMTVGYGHVIDNKKQLSYPISEKQAKLILLQDVNIAERAVRRLVRVPLTQGQFDALISLIFNIGVQAFEKSTLLKLLNSNEIDAVANEFSRWTYSKGQKLEGLVARRAAETLLFRGNT